MHKYIAKVIFDSDNQGTPRNKDIEEDVQQIKNMIQSEFEREDGRRVYSPDLALPGSSIFNSDANSAKESLCIILYITEDFYKNSWANFITDSAYLGEILSSNPGRIIPIVKGTAKVPRQAHLQNRLGFTDRITDVKAKLCKAIRSIKLELGEEQDEDDTHQENGGDAHFVPCGPAKLPVKLKDVQHIQAFMGGNASNDEAASRDGITEDRQSEKNRKMEKEREDMRQSIRYKTKHQGADLDDDDFKYDSEIPRLVGQGLLPTLRYEFHQRVLSKCSVIFIKNITDVNLLLDEMMAEDLILHFTWRDIREQTTTSDKIRMLMNIAIAMDKEWYMRFKICLESSGHSHLLDAVDNQEEQLKSGRLTSAPTVALVQNSNLNSWRSINHDSDDSQQFIVNALEELKHNEQLRIQQAKLLEKEIKLQNQERFEQGIRLEKEMVGVLLVTALNIVVCLLTRR